MRVSKSLDLKRNTETEAKKKKSLGDKIIGLFMPKPVDIFTSKEDRLKIE